MNVTTDNCDALLIFGVTGDPVCKKIFPALQALVRGGEPDIPVIGMARKGWTLEKLRERLHDSLEDHGELDADAFARLSAQLRYADGDHNDAATSHEAFPESSEPC